MSETSGNYANTPLSQADTNGAAKRKYPKRKPLSNAIQSNTTRTELTIKGKVSTTPKSVSASDFPLFRTFVLSPEADELFIKTTKNSIISLSTGDRFASNVTGYLVIL
jgi:Flp pilus assembly protein TadG